MFVDYSFYKTKKYVLVEVQHKSQKIIQAALNPLAKYLGELTNPQLQMQNLNALYS